jgi:hypothetical protein
MYDISDDFLTVVARERREQIQHEADLYHAMTESANLSFGPGPITQTRLSLARFLHRLAHDLQPAKYSVCDGAEEIRGW